MKFETVRLTENATLDIYVSDPVLNKKRKALLVIPGGGYSVVCSDREGEPIAQAFIPFGFNAFVLHYSVNRTHIFPTQLIEASLAVKHIKDHADEYYIEPEKVFCVGFSAGGHLAGSLGTMWNRSDVYAAAPMPYGYNKPAGMMLVYPVLNDHIGSFKNLLGKDELTAEDINEVSVVEAVDENTCPAFIVHTVGDTMVPVKNSLDMASALTKAGIKYELHIFPHGDHGLALGNEITNLQPCRSTAYSEWVKLASLWAEQLFN